METVGAYTADRSAALSGVPKSTIHYWARKNVLVPSVSPERVKLWSYMDLLGLRTIYWLRQPKSREGMDIPRSKMRMVRRALRRLRELDLEIFDQERPVIAVTRSGEVIITPQGARPETLEGQALSPDLIDLIAPFDTEEGTHGPDLQRPSEFVRILPRKLSGAPHVVDTRIATESLYALSVRGFSEDRIADLYPVLPRAAILDALRLEAQLANGFRAAA
jgi:uncharacterized protein (DUF433 family)